MKNERAWVLRWRRLIVDAFVVTATFALAFAAFAATEAPGDVPLVLVIAGALVGAGLIFEPRVTVPSVGEIGPRPLRLRQGLEAPPPEAQTGHFDGARIGATLA
jgi:hypothetical protein